MSKVNGIEVSVAEVVEYLKLQGRFETALQEVVQRKLTAAAAKKAAITVSDAQLQSAFDSYRIATGLNRAKETNDWIESKGLTLEAVESFVETNLLIDAFINQLEAKSNREKYLSSPEVKQTVRNLVYKEWLAGQLQAAPRA
ncbi:MAG: hypothetical protein HY720_22735 [Planctomycetes bacterium]|nr:hypothetical protein [Planctomycetota bacterium]